MGPTYTMMSDVETPRDSTARGGRAGPVITYAGYNQRYIYTRVIHIH